MGAAARTRLEKTFPARTSLGVLVAPGPASLRMAMVASFGVVALRLAGAFLSPDIYASRRLRVHCARRVRDRARFDRGFDNSESFNQFVRTIGRGRTDRCVMRTDRDDVPERYLAVTAAGIFLLFGSLLAMAFG